MPSPVYQWRKALRRNMAVNCSATRFHVSWMAVLLPMNVVDIFRPLGGMSQMADLTLFGIHSTKYDEFLLITSFSARGRAAAAVSAAHRVKSRRAAEMGCPKPRWPPRRVLSPPRRRAAAKRL
jgi:hypothetical protein